MEQKYKYMVCTRCLTFNHAPYIEDALNGFVIQQTTFPFVCVIVDDASTDGEAEVISRYLSQHFDLEDNTMSKNEETDDYHLIFARHKTNLNCFFSVYFLKYNHHGKKAKAPYYAEWLQNAKYIAICEGDDFWTDEDKLQTQVSFLESNSEYVLVYTDYNQIDDQGNDVWTVKHHRYSGVVTKKLLSEGNFILTASTCYRNYENDRRVEFRRIPFKLKMGDKPSWIYYSTRGKFKFINKKMVTYRVLKESASHSSDLKKMIDFNDNGEQIAKYFNKRYEVGLAEKDIEFLYLKGKVRLLAKYSRAEFASTWIKLIKKRPSILLNRRLSGIAFLRIVLNKTV